MHGGLSPELDQIGLIRDLDRPTEVPEHGLLCDLLWSDPDPFISGWGSNMRGISYTFGHDVIQEFLRKHDLDLIVRAHQVVEDGYTKRTSFSTHSKLHAHSLPRPAAFVSSYESMSTWSAPARSQRRAYRSYSKSSSRSYRSRSVSAAVHP
mmetsp:Transcript_35035/g.60343  ORF Transcript_35035/g.60343 Transcript_35035/m.60343 type:complete len:151 (+) Transcript_35035:104-556(+)